MSGYPNPNNYPNESYPDGNNFNGTGVPFVPNIGTGATGLTPAQAASLLQSGAFINPLAFSSTLTTSAPIAQSTATNANSAAAFAAADAAAAFLCQSYAQQYEAAYNAAAAAAAAKDQQQQQSQLNALGQVPLPFLNPGVFGGTVPTQSNGTFNPLQQFAPTSATFPAMSTTTYSQPFPQIPVNANNMNNPTASSPMRTVSSTLTAQSIPPASICRDFQLGRCTRGDACRYSHGQGTLSSAVNTSPQQQQQQPRQMCGDFLKGRCTRGDACRYSHDKMSGPPCRDFLKGVCTRGDSCRYHHFDPSSSVNVEFDSDDGDHDGDDES